MLSERERFRPAVSLFLLLLFPCGMQAGEWAIPVAGNAYRTQPAAGSEGFRRGGGLAWGDPAAVYSLFFRVDRPATLHLALVAGVAEGRSTIVARAADQEFAIPIEGSAAVRHEIGAIQIAEPGYVRVDLQGKERTGSMYAEVRELVVRSEDPSLVVDYVKNNEGNMFYWGRRGPSVHLSYQVPQDSSLRYGYTELMVPEGQDPIGSYFMANGFAEGYFGIQVNSAQERRILFSVWSPFQTDNPREIPEDQRVVALARGPEVRIGEFGNEGSGGQSFLVYPWKAGTTYRFLTEVAPDGKGNTIYTSWFAEQGDDQPWRLVASFRRPKTETWLRGFHSFLESFSPEYGYLERRVLYQNVWVRDNDQQWHECIKGRLSVDATGGGRHRLDFDGGVEEGAFFLRNCGFFARSGQPGTVFQRASATPPAIDFDRLPRQ